MPRRAYTITGTQGGPFNGSILSEVVSRDSTGIFARAHRRSPIIALYA